MKALTGIKDVDMKILQELEDSDFERVCKVNKYINSICNDDQFWINRLIFKEEMIMNNYLKKLKKNFSYKELYRYLFIDKKAGLEKAIETDNLPLFKRLKNYEISQEIVKKIAENGAENISLYLIIKARDDEDEEDSRLILDTLFANATLELFEFLDEFDVADYKMYVLGKILTMEDPTKEIRYYEKEVSYEDLFPALAKRICLFPIESNEKLLNFVMEDEEFHHKQFVNLLIDGVDPNCKDYKRWKKFVDNKFNKLIEQYKLKYRIN